MRAVAPIAIAVAAILAACGLSVGGLGDVPAALDASADAVSPLDGTSGPDAAGPLDAGSDAIAAGDDAGDESDAADAEPIDAGPCDGLRCNGACLADASDCTACDGGPLLCAATRVCGAACSACPDRPIQCFDCDSNGKNPVGACAPQDAGAYCLNGNYPRGNCACANKNDPAPCPGATQTCGDIGVFAIGCMTCGESGSNGLACRAGGACNEATATCR